MTKVLKIEFSPYTLRSKKPPNSKTKQTERLGSLLKFTFKDFNVGYADCHPLVEFGDAPLKKQLALLKDKKFTNITQRSLSFALLDAQCRSQLKSVFDEISHFPKNHFTSPALIKKEDILAKSQEGFTKFKFKFGMHLANEINYVKDMASFFREQSLKMRLDFNGNMTKKSILEELMSYKDIIDFIEDPFDDLNEKTYRLLQEYKDIFGFAMDFITPETQEQKQAFSYHVIKPARENIQKIKPIKSQNIIFTSSMDHPFGQMCALYEASSYEQRSLDLECGLLTDHLFEDNAYSSQLNKRNSELLPGQGFGFGFDNLLRAEPWRKLF